jgi:RNA polymerase sigma-70 factor (ECF subfamily)
MVAAGFRRWRGRCGRARVARVLINWVRLGARVPGVALRPVEVNGGQITSVSSIVNPDKLAHLGPVADDVSLLQSAR